MPGANGANPKFACSETEWDEVFNAMDAADPQEVAQRAQPVAFLHSLLMPTGTKAKWKGIRPSQVISAARARADARDAAAAARDRSRSRGRGDLANDASSDSAGMAGQVDASSPVLDADADAAVQRVEAAAKLATCDAVMKHIAKQAASIACGLLQQEGWTRPPPARVPQVPGGADDEPMYTPSARQQQQPVLLGPGPPLVPQTPAGAMAPSASSSIASPAAPVAISSTPLPPIRTQPFMPPLVRVPMVNGLPVSPLWDHLPPAGWSLYGPWPRSPVLRHP